MKPSRLAYLGAYGVAFMLIVIPVTELVLRLWPLELLDFRWRFGATGVLTTTVITPLLGILIGGAIALSADHRRMMRLFAVVAMTGAAMLIPLSGLFLLDARSLRTQTMPEALFVFDATAVQALLKLGVVIFVAGLLGVGGWVSARDRSSGRREVRELVGRPGGLRTEEKGK